MNKSRIII